MIANANGVGNVGKTGWYDRVGKKARRKETVCGLFLMFSNPPSAQQLLKISSLEAEKKQAVAGVLNTDA